MLLTSVEILQTISEFPAKPKPGTSSDIDPTTSDFIELLTQHEEAILKHLLDEVDWNNEKQATADQFLADPYHKLDAARHIQMPVHVPSMFSYTFLGMVTDTTATLKGEDKALHTEKTVWTSKHARDGLRTRHKAFIEHQEKPQWLDDEIKLRNKSLTVEADKVRKVRNLKKPGAAKAGEPPSGSDDELEKAQPKPKPPQKKVWNPMNRKVHEDPPRGHVNKLGEDFGGCTNKDRNAGVMACFMNGAGTQKRRSTTGACTTAGRTGTG